MTDLRTAAQQALEAHATRYQVVRDGYWWRVKIGDGTQTVGQHHTETGALRLASELHRAFHDGGFVVQEALKAALEQPEQEPVAWIQPDHLQKAKQAPFLCRVEPTQRCADFVPFFTHPPRREWRGLTEEDIWTLAANSLDSVLGRLHFARAIEATLKERNA